MEFVLHALDRSPYSYYQLPYCVLYRNRPARNDLGFLLPPRQVLRFVGEEEHQQRRVCRTYFKTVEQKNEVITSMPIHERRVMPYRKGAEAQRNTTLVIS